MSPQAQCPACGGVMDYDAQDAGQQANCPGCNALLTLPPLAAMAVQAAAPQRKGKLVQKSEVAGTGCLIQAAGVALGFLSLCGFALGAAVGFIGLFTFGIMAIVLIAYGSTRATRFECGCCNNPLSNGDVRLCPSCQAVLTK